MTTPSEILGQLAGLGAAPSPAEVESIRREIERVRASAARDRTLFDAVVNASPHGIIVCGVDGRLVLQNPASERIWAGSASAGSVADWGKFRAFHLDGRPYQADDWSMARCLSRGESVEAEEIHIQRFDDSFGVLLGSSAPLLDGEGRLEGAVAIFVDITTFRRAEQRMALVANNLPVLVSYVDSSQRYRFMNRTYERWFGRPPEQVIGKTVLEVVGETIYRETQPRIARALAGETVRFELRVEMPSLGERELEATFTPDFAPDGSVHGTVNLVTDVTERHKLEAALEQDRRTLRDAAARLNLLATVSRAFALAESNLPVLLHTVVEQVVGRFGDAAAITLRSGGRRIHRAEGDMTTPVVFDCDPEAWVLARDAAGALGAHPSVAAAIDAIVTNNRAHAVDAKALAAAWSAPPAGPLLRWTERYPIRNLLAVPLRMGTA